MDKFIPRKVWVVDEKKVNEDNTNPLSPDEMIEAFNSQGHVHT